MGEERRADALDRAHCIEKRVRIEVVLGGAERLVEVAVPVRVIVEVDLLPIGKNGASAQSRGAVRAAEDARRGFGEAARCAVRHVDGRCLLVGDGRCDPAALALDAPGEIDGEVLAVAFLGNAVARADAKPFELGVGDDVDHARNGVSAVDGGGAVLQHVDALDDGDGDHVEVGRGVGARASGDETTVVEENQRALDAKAAQIDLRRAIAVARPVGGRLVTREAGIGGKPLEDGLDVDHARVLDRLGRDDVGGSNAGDVGAADARTGDDDAFALIAARLGGGRRLGLRLRRRLGLRCSSRARVCLGDLGRGGLRSVRYRLGHSRSCCRRQDRARKQTCTESHHCRSSPSLEAGMDAKCLYMSIYIRRGIAAADRLPISGNTADAHC